MEVIMITDSERLARVEPDPMDRTTPRRALVGAASVSAIIAVMFVTFYAINAQRTNQAATGAATTASAPAGAETTGQR
jgi:hypothetical protein